MEQVLVVKFQIYVLCWTIAFYVFFDFVMAASQGVLSLAFFNAILTLFWVSWPFKLVSDGRKQLRNISRYE